MRTVLSCLVFLMHAAASTGATPDVALHARALAPGEPLRIVVRAETTLRSIRGAFLEREIAFNRTGEDAAGNTAWTGWTLIPLDQAAGRVTLALDCTAVDGSRSRVERNVEIRAKRFPEERLDVDRRYVEPPAEVQARILRERQLLERVYARRTPPVTPSEPFRRPVPGGATSTFGLRRFFNDEPRSPHPGLDLRAAEGTPVRGAAAGTVVLARDLYYAGNTVILDHGGGLFTIYAHLSRIEVAEGDLATAGQQLGRSGSTGRVTGPHLHWGAKIGDEPFDPIALLDPALFGPS